jgi:hypothetical protein
MRIFASMLLAPSHMAVAPEIGGLVIAGRTGRGLIDLRCEPDWLRGAASAKDAPLRSVPSCRWIHSLCMTPCLSASAQLEVHRPAYVSLHHRTFSGKTGNWWRAESGLQRRTLNSERTASVRLDLSTAGRGRRVPRAR